MCFSKVKSPKSALPKANQTDTSSSVGVTERTNRYMSLKVAWSFFIMRLKTMTVSPNSSTSMSNSVNKTFSGPRRTQKKSPGGGRRFLRGAPRLRRDGRGKTFRRGPAGCVLAGGRTPGMLQSGMFENPFGPAQRTGNEHRRRPTADWGTICRKAASHRPYPVRQRCPFPGEGSALAFSHFKPKIYLGMTKCKG